MWQLGLYTPHPSPSGEMNNLKKQLALDYLLQWSSEFTTLLIHTWLSVPWNNAKLLILIYIWLRQWHPTPVLLPGKSHEQRSLVGCSPWGRQESDTTEQLHFQFSLPCIGEGSGYPLQCSCLENPRDGGAWWAAVYGVAQSRTRLKQLSRLSSKYIR